VFRLNGREAFNLVCNGFERAGDCDLGSQRASQTLFGLWNSGAEKRLTTGSLRNLGRLHPFAGPHREGELAPGHGTAGQHLSGLMPARMCAVRITPSRPGACGPDGM